MSLRHRIRAPRRPAPGPQGATAATAAFMAADADDGEETGGKGARRVLQKKQTFAKLWSNVYILCSRYELTDSTLRVQGSRAAMAWPPPFSTRSAPPILS